MTASKNINLQLVCFTRLMLSFLTFLKQNIFSALKQSNAFSNSVLEIYKVFQEEAYSIAIHPSGLYILVGFSDKLRLMNLLIDDIRTFKEFPIRGCKEVSIFVFVFINSVVCFEILIY